MRAKPGKHSVIIYDSGQYFCREIFVDLKVHNLDLQSKQVNFKQEYDPLGFSLFSSQEVEITRS